MAFFIPHSIQKRLLRYALSRLELLDTDALNLDTLEIGWGKRSTVELQDVGLRKEKLTALLKLPERLSIERATVGRVRITVPADLHTSSIVVEVSSVEARVRLYNEEEIGRRGGESTKRTPSWRRSSQKARSTSAAQDLPDPEYLAKSFLQEETPQERAQLEAALNAQSADLSASVGSSDAGSGSVPSGPGFGAGFGLPAFLASFLKGIGDRLQVCTTDVTIKLDCFLDLPGDDELSSSGPKPTTVCFRVDDILLGNDHGGHFSEPKDTNDIRLKPEGPGDGLHPAPSKHRVILNGVRGQLICEPAIFSHLFEQTSSANYSSSHSDPLATSLQSPTRQTPPSRSKQPQGSRSRSDYDDAETGLSALHSDTADAIAPDSAFRASLPFDVSEGEDNEFLAYSSTSGRRWSTGSNDIDHDADNEVHPSESRSQQLHDSLTRFREERSNLHQERLSMHDRFQRATFPKTTTPRRSPPARSPTSSKNMPGMFQTQTIYRPPDVDDFRETVPHTGPRTYEEETETPLNEDLAQSQYFSHEEAESIYMSALHESTNLPEPEPSRMPGHWQEADDPEESGPPDSIRASPSLGTGIIEAQDGHASARCSGGRESGNFGQVDAGLVTNADFPSKSSYSSFLPPSAVAKNIIDMDTVAILIGQGASGADSLEPNARSPTIPQPDCGRTARKSVPGSFSSYAESSASIGGGVSARNGSFIASSDIEEGDQPTSAIDIEAGIASLQMDLPMFRVLYSLVSKLQTIYSPADESTPRRRSKIAIPLAATANEAYPSLQLRFKELAVGLFDVVKPEPFRGRGTVHLSSAPVDRGASLANLELNDIFLSTSSSGSSLETRLEFGEIALGLGETKVLSFSQTRNLRTSIDDLTGESNADASISFSKRRRGSEIHIWTRPVVLLLDMFKIDTTLESIGGLSGLLELGSSIMSDSTVISRSNVPPPKAKGVRFEASTKLPSDEPTGTEMKVNVKVGGLTMRLLGELCSIETQCSPIAVVSRAGGVRARVGDIILKGPQLEGVEQEAACRVIARDARLHYLYLPEEADLQRLIKLMTPSNDRFEEKDDFLVDTLMRQRKKGAVLRFDLAAAEAHCDDIAVIDHLQKFALDMSRLSAVTKYLPQETRPGLLTLASVRSLTSSVSTRTSLGDVLLSLGHVEVAHISAPALVASSIGTVSLLLDKQQPLVHELVPGAGQNARSPMLMARMIEDELEPHVTIKLWNACFEYTVPFLSACTAAMSELAAVMDTSHHNVKSALSEEATTSPSRNSKDPKACSKPLPLRIDLTFRDCAFGLNPNGLPSKGLFMMNDASVAGSLPDDKGSSIDVHLRKAEMLIVDDISRLGSTSSSPGRSSSTAMMPISRDLCWQGYVNVCSISTASFEVSTSRSADVADQTCYVNVDVRDELLLLETCADSTQTLVEIFGGLSPPATSGNGEKYRTEVAPVEDLMASFLGDAFVVPENSAPPEMPNEDVFALSSEDEFPNEGLDDDDFDSYDDSSNAGDDIRSDPGDDALEESIYGGFDFDEVTDPDACDKMVLKEQPTGAFAATPAQMQESILGSLHIAQLPPQIHAKAKRFDSRRNKYLPVSTSETAKCPIKVHAHDMHIIWNMYDGYDWEHTRDVITQAVQDVEARAEENLKSRRAAVDKVDDDESVIGDCLFNSIYIGVPAKGDPKDLAGQINHDIDDLISETASRTAPSGTSTATSRRGSSHRPRTPRRKLKLDRSKRHKIAFELRGVSSDFYAFPPGGETQNSMDICIRDFEIFDHVPTSTWKKFATYMHDAGPREDKKPMVHLEICDVRPVADLTASELVIRATVLPLRLHVDQDALDFITRFFGFKDNSKPLSSSVSEQPFLQRIEIPSIPVKLDYKPKKIDYAALRSGRTKEFMNFMILDGSDFILKHVCLYGVSGLDKMHEMLEDIWMADVKSPQQLPGVLSGLNGVRTLVNVGTGMRDLVQIPIREYKKDGRIVRSISKGALAFGRTTGGELTRFGAKLAIGAQRALQGAEGVFLGPGRSSRHDQDWEDADLDEDEERAFSHYANQPIGILQGLKGAARSLERDLLVTRDVVIAISGEVRESGSVEGAARAVARHAPTLILRPMIGASKALGQTMMGATNTVDPANRRRMEDKYKRY